MVYPFDLHESCKNFSQVYYPDLNTLKHISTLNFGERKKIVRMYFTEGIPKAFINNPALYEGIRTWLGKQLNVEPKFISITGSARIGYSLNPFKTIGEPFTNKSDLDFVVIDASLFDLLVKDWFVFAEEIDKQINKGKISERLTNNVLLIDQSIRNGYIDQSKMPDWPTLVTVNRCYNTLRHLLRRMGVTENCPQPRDASIRVYKTWDFCVNRITKNVSDSLHKVQG